MNTGPATRPIPAQPTSQRPLRQGPTLIVLGLLSLLATGCFKPGSSVQALRDSLQQATGEAWMSEVELGVGALTLGLARAGGAVLDLPPEARAVLQSVRNADVGVYRLRYPDRVVSGAAVLSAGDRALAPQGWDRLVGVIDGRHKTVAIYVANEPEWTRRIKLCVVVIDGPQMVIVSARGNPEPLLELALAQAQHDAPLASAR
jgi:hypothetical protein